MLIMNFEILSLSILFLLVSNASTENLDMNCSITQDPINNIVRQFFSSIRDQLKDMKFTGIIIELNDWILTTEQIVLNISHYDEKDLNVTFLGDSSKLFVTGKPFSMSGKNTMKLTEPNEVLDFFIKIKNVEFNMTIDFNDPSKGTQINELNLRIPKKSVNISMKKTESINRDVHRKKIAKRLIAHLRDKILYEIKTGLESYINKKFQSILVSLTQEGELNNKLVMH